MVLSPVVLSRPKQYIWPWSAVTQLVVCPAATTQSGGHKFLSPPWISTIFGVHSSFWTL